MEYPFVNIHLLLSFFAHILKYENNKNVKFLYMACNQFINVIKYFFMFPLIFSLLLKYDDIRDVNALLK